MGWVLDLTEFFSRCLMLNLKSLLHRLSKSNVRTYSNTNVNSLNEKPIELAKNNQNIPKLLMIVYSNTLTVNTLLLINYLEMILFTYFELFIWNWIFPKNNSILCNFDSVAVSFFFFDFLCLSCGKFACFAFASGSPNK